MRIKKEQRTKSRIRNNQKKKSRSNVKPPPPLATAPQVLQWEKLHFHACSPECGVHCCPSCFWTTFSWRNRWRISKQPRDSRELFGEVVAACLFCFALRPQFATPTKSFQPFTEVYCPALVVGTTKYLADSRRQLNITYNHQYAEDVSIAGACFTRRWSFGGMILIRATPSTSVWTSASEIVNEWYCALTLKSSIVKIDFENSNLFDLTPVAEKLRPPRSPVLSPLPRNQTNTFINKSIYDLEINHFLLRSKLTKIHFCYLAQINHSNVLVSHRDHHG